MVEDTNNKDGISPSQTIQIDIFVASDAILEFVDPPITMDDMKDDRLQKIEKTELLPLADRLITIQQQLATNLRTIIGGAQTGPHASDVQIITETPGYYILYDRQYVLTEGLHKECGVTHTTLKSHAIAASKLLDRLRIDTQEHTAPRWIIKKPPHWYDGQWVLIQTIQELIEEGLTPTETLDYLIISVMDVPVSYWSRIRETTESALHTRMRTAREKLEASSRQATDSTTQYDYFTRTYTSQTVDGKELISVDNGFLHSRRDIADSAVTGNMKSGHSGAGSKQLATAILADAFDEDRAVKLNHKLNGQVQNIATSTGDANWTLTKDELSHWVLTNTQ